MSNDLQTLKARMNSHHLVRQADEHADISLHWIIKMILGDDDDCDSCENGCSISTYNGCSHGCSVGNPGG